MTAPDGPITDEMLVAFADGEADRETAERIEAALEEDEALASRLEAFVTTRAVLKRAFDHVAREPVPDRLTAFVMSNGQATAAPKRTGIAPALRRAAERWSGARGWSMAAALALTVGLGGYLAGYRQGGAPEQGGAFGVLAAAGKVLGESLEILPDGATLAFGNGQHKGEIVLRESYRTRQGYCRTFGVTEAKTGLGGVACRTQDGWRMEVAIAEGETIGGFAPASGVARALDVFLDAAEAEDPLSADAVSKKIRSGWR
jgi:hypothetical protein